MRYDGESYNEKYDICEQSETENSLKERNEKSYFLRCCGYGVRVEGERMVDVMYKNEVRGSRPEGRRRN